MDFYAQGKLYAYPGTNKDRHFNLFSGTWASFHLFLFDLTSSQ